LLILILVYEREAEKVQNGANWLVVILNEGWFGENTAVSRLAYPNLQG